MRPAHLDLLLSPINKLKGVGPKIENIINKLGINLNIHFLWHFPYKIIEKKYYENIHDAPLNQFVTLKIEVIKHYPSKFRRQPYRVSCLANETAIDIVYFNARHPVIRSILPPKNFKMISGKLEFFKNKFQITHPSNIENVTDIQLLREKEPVYSLTAGLNMKTFIKLSNQVLDSIPNLKEWIEERLLLKYNFISWKEAIEKLHNPEIEDTYSEKNVFRRRLAFDELLAHQLAICIIRTIDNKKISVVFKNNNKLKNNLIKNLEFKLTNSQINVVNEIQKDLVSNKQMIRLLQGDVGSGKTIVAFMTMLIAIDNKFQACLMAPTEILAQQHYKSIKALTNKLGLNVALITGSTKKNNRSPILKDLKNGKINILIGTHTLIEDSIIFNNLGIAIIDEQHKFGVAQRSKLWTKNSLPPHILVMTATPIPRTLAMTLYGDLDVSIIDELPPGRKLIKTVHRNDSKRLSVFNFIKNEIIKGRQIYIVYPLIEESKKMDYKDLLDGFESISRSFPLPDYKISILNGRMKNDEKEYEMNRFIKGETQIMVSTTVIEVGVNVPNASVMIIESSERFGLSQLHQLRGRVGRGNSQSYCILMTGDKLSSDSKLRINTMVKTNNGFEIADVDLKIRGPGNLMGTQQSGILKMKIADLINDNELLNLARKSADEILSSDKNLEKKSNQCIKYTLSEIGTFKNIWNYIS